MCAVLPSRVGVFTVKRFVPAKGRARTLRRGTPPGAPAWMAPGRLQLRQGCPCPSSRACARASSAAASRGSSSAVRRITVSSLAAASCTRTTDGRAGGRAHPIITAIGRRRDGTGTAQPGTGAAGESAQGACAYLPPVVIGAVARHTMASRLVHDPVARKLRASNMAV